MPRPVTASPTRPARRACTTTAITRSCSYNPNARTRRDSPWSCITASDASAAASSIDRSIDRNRHPYSYSKKFSHMIHRSIHDQTLALAGVFQAVGLVRDVAHEGRADPAAVAVYGGVRSLRPGLELMVKQVGQARTPENIEITKYVVSVLHLERQLAKNPAMLQRIGDGVEKARGQSAHFDITHENILASLAGCYTDTLSTLTPRGVVTGAQGHLSNPDVANKVRTLLLAAIRSAVLWRQCGGSRWQLVFSRRKIIDTAKQFLAEMNRCCGAARVLTYNADIQIRLRRSQHGLLFPHSGLSHRRTLRRQDRRAAADLQ